MLRKQLCGCLCVLLFPTISQSQNSQPDTLPSSCPIQFVSFNPAGVSVKLKNTSGKTIVGIVFNTALADATEHWRWFHWNFDDGRPLRDFGWNKAIKPAQTKRLTWPWTGLDFEHIGGGIFVLTSVLFDDGSRWEDSNDTCSCKALWLKHKKSTFRPVELPPRGQQ